ncbi:myb-related protein Zm38 [Prunus yedoensis var. nudiflora]|uniref:Myb-related protein Zm38 n=1 Tax=Prunus yedoensis var. nudiflora TaxID=2094558 RepID=A0A315ATP8_PRUYE|nr:myb-related protein Zm38 [Prunus yedoensis var. nudiflora]
MESSSSMVPMPSAAARSLDVFKGWNVGGGWPASKSSNVDLESPTSTLTYNSSEQINVNASASAVVVPPIMQPMIEFVGSSGSSETKEEGLHDHITMSLEAGAWTGEVHDHHQEGGGGVSSNVDMADQDGFTDLLLNNSDEVQSLSDGERRSRGDSDNGGGSGSGSGSDYYEDNKNYWNSILNLVNSSL